MAIAKMKLVNITGQYSRLNDTIRACLDSGCYHPENTAGLMEQVHGFTHINEENPYGAALAKITEILRLSGIPAKPLEGDSEEYTLAEIQEYFTQLDERLLSMQKTAAGLEKELYEIDEAREQLKHFFGLHIRLEEVFACQFIEVRFGRIPAESYEKLKAYTVNPYVLFFPCSSDNQYYWGMYVTPVSQKENIDRIFQSLFFERLWIPSAVGAPEEAAAQLERQREEKSMELAEIRQKIQEYTDKEQQKCRRIYTQILRNYEIYETRKFSAKRGNTFMQIGWVPADQTEKIASRLEQVEGIEFQIEEPEVLERAKPPSRLKNIRALRPFEFFVKMYGVPSYDEIDPTPFVALTYTVLFGIMFADLGQGLVLALAGLLMYKLKGMELGRILIPCGISGAVFGLIFGSFFGFEHALDPLYHAIGFEEKPIEIMDSVNSILIVSLAIGMLLVVCAMLLSIYSGFRRREWGEVLFGVNGICGLSVYGCALALAGGAVLGKKIPVLPVALPGIVLPLLLIYLREPLSGLVERKPRWQPEKWGEYLMQSFFELFEAVLSYVTNTVSFLRVGAFVLVHAGMMTTFLYLSELVGGGIPGALMLVFGNGFVILLEGLLVGIQVLRLEFYEMFSRFYQGRGRPFTPAVYGR